MEYLQKELNRKIGEAMRKQRRKKRVTQEGLRLKISNYFATQLKKIGFTESEISQYFEGEISETLEKKLAKQGIKEKYKLIAASTISKYENGEWDIPAWYVQLIKEICGDFQI